MIEATTALERLKTGNNAFAACVERGETPALPARAAELVQVQAPFATILGCSDARVPAEIVFNQGPGDLFVIRVAGNIATPSQIGSVEFASAMFGTPLVVVLGHTQCGAVTATLDALQDTEPTRSQNLRTIVDCVRPSVEPLLDTDLRHDRDALIGAGVRANIAASVRQLREGSDILAALLADDALVIVGAEYAIETGRVSFFDAQGAP